MKFQKRSGTKIQMTCFQCRGSCAPKDGNWHDGADNQIFLCRNCETKHLAVRAKLRSSPSFSIPTTA